MLKQNCDQFNFNRLYLLFVSLSTHSYHASICRPNTCGQQLIEEIGCASYVLVVSGTHFEILVSDGIVQNQCVWMYKTVD